MLEFGGMSNNRHKEHLDITKDVFMLELLNMYRIVVAVFVEDVD